MSQQLADRPPTQDPNGPTVGDEPVDRRWTRDEYERLVNLGLFDDERVELFEGRIYRMAAMKVPHRVALELADRYARVAFPQGYRICVQMPMRCADDSAPEPDLAVVPGDPRDIGAAGHPSSAALVIEISDTTLRHDRQKARAYDASGVGDYWIINLNDRRLEVHRDPLPVATTASAPYASVHVLGPDDTVAPLAAPDRKVKVADLLP